MIHYVLLTRDAVGREVLDSRVIDVDASDGLDPAGRVNAGIDLMLGAARDTDLRVGPIGVAGRRRELRARGSGQRRQIRLVTESEAVVTCLLDAGEIQRFDSVVVVDCGDTGMSMYLVSPPSGQISHLERSTAMTGRRLDRALVDAVSERGIAVADRGRIGRSALLSACRTAKEEIDYSAPGADGAVTLPERWGRVSLTAAIVEAAAAPMVEAARGALDRYLATVAMRATRPQAVVLVGGLANLPVVQRIVNTGDYELVRPAAPELVAATGAALAAARPSALSRLAFIGGRRQREWLSATPLAVVAAVLAAGLMTIYAVGSSLTGQQAPQPPVEVSSTSAPSSATTTTTTTTTEYSPSADSITATTTQLPPAPRPLPTIPTTTEWETGEPSWLTTELPPTTPSTTTRTLSPFPLPSLPFGPSQTFPPELLPPGLLPSTTAPTPQPPPPPEAVPRAPSSSSTPIPAR